MGMISSRGLCPEKKSNKDRSPKMTANKNKDRYIFLFALVQIP